MAEAVYKQEALRLRAEGRTIREICDQLFPGDPRAYGRVKKLLYRQRRAERRTIAPTGIEQKADGTMIFEGIVEMLAGAPITPDAIMAAHNLNPSDWEVVSYKSNFWQSQQKGGRKIDLYQSKITVKPRKDSICLSDIDRFFEQKNYSAIPPIVPAHYAPDGDVLEVCIPDLHSGLFSWREETGEDYDHYIVRERFETCIADILARCEDRKFSKVLFVTLGDLLHVDNLKQETTKGTFQDVDGRFSKFFENTLDLLIDAVRAFEQIAPVEVVYIQGNHDGITGYTLLKSVQMAFADHKDVFVDALPNPRKWRRIGVNLIGWCHGDMSTKRIAQWLHQEARMEYGQTEYAEIHAGHLHSQLTQDGNGVIVRYLPTICSSSAWEHKQGYNSAWRGIVSFVWAPKRGLREMWYSPVISERSEAV